MTLTEFLAARYDETEAGAGDFHDARRCGSLDRDGGFEPDWCDCGHPARVLREVEAGRKILAGRWGGPDHEDMWDHHVRLLAAVWCDHPDYDESWRP